MVEFYNKNKQLINNILFLLVLIFFIYFFFNFAFAYVSPFVIGYIISLFLNPFADYFDFKHKINRGVAALFLIIISILLLITLGTAIVSKIGNEIEQFSANMPLIIDEITKLINNLRQSVDDVLSFVPEDFKISVDEMLSQLAVTTTSILGSTVKNGSINVVSTIPNILMNIVLGIVSAFFFIKDKYVIKSFFESEKFSWAADHFSIVKKGLITALTGYVKAQLIVMSVIASICILGLSIIGNPYAIIIGLLISLIDALPIFGLGSIFWPWILFSFLNGNTSQAVSLCILYGVAFLTRQFIEPKVVGQQIGVHPILTLMSIYIGLKIFGVGGLLLVAGIIVIIAKIILEQGEN